MFSNRFTKDPDAITDYKIDWSDWLVASDVIVTSTWIVPAGIVKDSDSKTFSDTTIILSLGLIGVTYPVINRITTVSGLTEDRTIYIQVRDK